MNNDIRVLELPRRNAESVMQRLREMELKLVEQQQRIDGLNNLVSALLQRLSGTEEFVTQERIKRMGSGATVR
jgi:hypothetical protein